MARGQAGGSGRSLLRARRLHRPQRRVWQLRPQRRRRLSLHCLLVLLLVRVHGVHHDVVGESRIMLVRGVRADGANRVEFAQVARPE